MKLRRSSEAAGVIQNAERQRSNLEKAATVKIFTIYLTDDS